ncbi:short-chain type dehydrogenase/reductase-like [Melia azedarach]|uniref:Short-chain type dehydrogenase/reductase-like n=1 Tax=Melia azedarach TaxID=155640 RepID=A0ACC1YDE0_MELAZ|nr:short-chain type dehydrogenase/reductase-like [Melia azedarach]
MDDKHPTIANTSVEDFDKTVRANTRGTFLCCREAANRLKRGFGGRIILMSTSLVGPVATEMFLAGRSQEYVNMGIEDCPLGRPGETIDVAKVIEFLACDDSEWVNGQVIIVNGGLVV